jgi:hypothetical protein
MAQPKVRDDWLKFNDSDYRTHDEAATKAFYELLSERQTDENIRSAKLTTARQVRALRDIVGKPGALHILSDPDKTLQDAIDAAEIENMAAAETSLEASLATALLALRKPNVEQYLQPTQRAVEIWTELASFVEKVKKFFSPPQNPPGATQ